MNNTTLLSHQYSSRELPQISIISQRSLFAPRGPGLWVAGGRTIRMALFRLFLMWNHLFDNFHWKMGFIDQNNRVL